MASDKNNITALNKLTFCADVTFPRISSPQLSSGTIERVITIPEQSNSDEINILPSLGENTSAIQNELALSIRASFWLFTLSTINISPEQINDMAQIFKNNFYTGDEYLTTELEQNLLDSNNEKDMRNKLNFFRSSIIDLLTPEQVTEFIQAENKFIAQDSGILSELKSTPIRTSITENLTHETEETSRTQHLRFTVESEPIFPLRPTQRLWPISAEQGSDNIPRNAYKDTISCQIRHLFIPIENISSNPAYNAQNNQQAYDAIISQTPHPINLGFTKQEVFQQAIIHQQFIASTSNNPKIDIQNQAKLFSWAIKNNINLGITIASKDKALYLAALTTIENYPSIIYCKSGKDRTAVTASLIQAMIKTYAETGTLIDLAEPIFESTLQEPSKHKTIDLIYFRSGCCLNDEQIQTLTSTINPNPTNTATHFVNLCDTNLLSGDFRYARLSWDLLARTLKKQESDDNKIKVTPSLATKTNTNSKISRLFIQKNNLA